MSNFLKFTPIGLEILLACWTIAVAPYSRYGSNWAIYPVLVALPVFLILHLVLIVKVKPKLPMIIYAIGSGAVFLLIWFLALMWVSKDSL